MNVVLASASPTRAALLRAAGVAFEIDPAAVDEEAVKQSLLAEGTAPHAIAGALAELKAIRVSQRRPDDMVIGADLVLEFEGRLVSKSESLADARALLLELRGKRHALHCAAALAKAGAPVWRHGAKAALWMRAFSADCLDAYLARHGESLLGGVGCYRIEDDGIQLFERIDGDYFAILGLPLLPLLNALREHSLLVR